MSASELKQFYLDKGAELFEKLPFFKFVKRLLYWTYSKENLEKELKDVFGETKLFEIDRLLSIQTKDTRTSLRVTSWETPLQTAYRLCSVCLLGCCSAAGSRIRTQLG